MTGSESVIHLLPHTTLNFTENSALITGGALHMETGIEYGQIPYLFGIYLFLT